MSRWRERRLAWLPYAAALLLAAPHAAEAFYLPGIAPTDYKAGSPMNVKVARPRPPAAQRPRRAGPRTQRAGGAPDAAPACLRLSVYPPACVRRWDRGP